MLRVLVILTALVSSLSLTRAHAYSGADIPWANYEAEDMKTTGEVLGPKYDAFLVETESSGLKCVKLTGTNQYVEFKAQLAANALVVRYSLPDAPAGGGIDSSLDLYVNHKLVRQIPVTSRYTWLYGKYPFSNDPQDGKPRNFYDEARVKNLKIHHGDVVRIQKNTPDGDYCVIDLVNLENIAPPLTEPKDALSVKDVRFGAGGAGDTDDTEAVRKCLVAAKTEGKTVWLPAGVYKIAGDLNVPGGMTVQGSGMWHTTLVGDEKLYGDAQKRVRINGQGSNIHIADLAIIGKLNYRSDREPNDSFGESFGTNSTISRVWVEHTKTGMWLNNSSNLVVEDSRFRDTIADGVNFCVGMTHSTIRNCTTRGTGDDCFAFWPATHAQQTYTPGHNLVTHCTGQLPFLANGGAIYGGDSNRIEDSRFVDITPGCGVLISTTFPTANADRHIDNNFSGLTVVKNCEIIRCGGTDHDWDWRAAFELTLDRRSISGLDIENVSIKDSLSYGFRVVSPGAKHGDGTLSQTRITNLNIPNYGIGTTNAHGLWIREDAQGGLTLKHSQVVETVNASKNFTIHQE